MDEEKLKTTFQRIKQDIDSLKNEINSLRESIIDLASILQNDSAQNQINPTHNSYLPNIPAQIQHINESFKVQKSQNHVFSTGNRGVPTDRQTDQQTDKSTSFKGFNEVPVLLDSLDNVKKELRTKFKQLTDQEMLIFSTIYQLDEEIGYADYKILSEKLSLTESSIRDYVGKLIKKGIPLEKQKIKNKSIQISIPSNLKKIASLQTITQLKYI